MDNIPENVKNKALYKKAKDQADKIYKRDGLYKSAYIVKAYKEMGGTYTGKKDTSKGVRRWLEQEQWVNVLNYLRDGSRVPCGEGPKVEACRPLVRATKDTPISLPELLRIHSKAHLMLIARQKERHPDWRINWERGTITKP
jgi:hypothetical protein